MSTDTVQQIPGISVTEEVNETPVENTTVWEQYHKWASNHRRSLLGVGAVSVALLVGASIYSLFRKKN